MIFVDPRDGSKELVTPLRKAGIEVDDKAELPGGDLYFVGRGEKGQPLNIGIEYKKFGELVSSLQTQRLQGHQLIEMRGAEEGQKPYYDIAYLLIQGEFPYDKSGMLVRRSGIKSYKPMGMTHDELLKRLNVLHLRGGLNWVKFATQDECVRWVVATYHTWTDQDLDEHKSHLAIYNPPSLVKPNQFQKTIRTLPSVGLQFGKAAEKAFGSLYRAITAPINQWAGLEAKDDDGKARKFGTSHATKVYEAIRKEN